MFSDRSILYLSNSLIDDEEWYKKPLARDNRLPEAIFDFNVEAGCAEDAMDQVLKCTSLYLI